MTAVFLSLVSPVQAGECILPVGPSGQLSLSSLAETLATCAGEAPAPLVWAEITDFGVYDVTWSAPEGSENRRATGLSHKDWSRNLLLQNGLIFGIRVQFQAQGDIVGETFELAYYRPGDDTPYQVETKALRPGNIEAAIFLLGRSEAMLPGLWRIELRHRGQVLAAQRFKLSAKE